MQYRSFYFPAIAVESCLATGTVIHKKESWKTQVSSLLTNQSLHLWLACVFLTSLAWVGGTVPWVDPGDFCSWGGSYFEDLTRQQKWTANEGFLYVGFRAFGACQVCSSIHAMICFLYHQTLGRINMNQQWATEMLRLYQLLLFCKVVCGLTPAAPNHYKIKPLSPGSCDICW